MINEIKNAASVVIMGHKNLDGDCLGAMLAMGHFCRNEFGKDPVLAFEGVIPDSLRFLSNGWWMKKARDVKECGFDLAIILDVADAGAQLGDDAREILAASKRKIKIDHHLNSAADADLNIIERSSAVCEVIAGIAVENGWEITHKIAEFLYAGIYTDTGGFIHDYTTPDTMRKVAGLMECGARPNEIVRKISEKTKETFLNNAETLSRTLFADDNQIGYAAFSVKKTEDGVRPHRETTWLHRQILTVRDVEAAAIFKELDDGGGRIQVSLRAKTKPINKFAEGFGGGGHEFAAAFSVEGSLASAVATVIPKLQAFISRT